jgi:hypothetical protein
MDKASLLESIKAERARLGALLKTLDEEAFTWTPAPGTWSAKDNIAHLNHWESEMIANLGRIARGEEAQHEPGTVDEQNARVYRENASLPADDVLAAFRQNGHDLLAVLEPFPEALLFAVGKFAWLDDGKVLADYVDGDSAEHYAEHRAQIEALLDSR